MAGTSYRDLLVWQKAVDLATCVYETTRNFPAAERYALSDQMRRAAVSVPSNIAEGQARQSAKEFSHFLYVALGSLAELDTQLTIARKLGYVEEGETGPLGGRLTEVRRMVGGLLAKVGA